MLTIQQAKQELNIAVQRNPGLWEQHSLVAADNARRIAERISTMDSEKAYIMGLMHDIGRREGITGMLHVIDGYNYMMQLGEPDLAVICLTHSFASQNVEHFEGKHDCSAEQKAFIKDFVEKRVYDDYDKLIQLCDALSLPTGACIVEKRLVDVALRHGMQDYTTTRWRAYLNLKKYFDTLCGCDIYTLLPGVFENSMTNLI
jgi:hypothetical protein